MTAYGHPTSYPGIGSRACDACLETGRGTVVMKPFFMRDLTCDAGSLVFACPRCQHQTVEVLEAVPLGELSKPTAMIFKT